MPGKKKAAKKAGGNKDSKAAQKEKQKKKEALLADRTFGLKNKNKSKKAQVMIKSMEKQLLGTGDQRSAKQRKAEKEAAKKEQLELQALYKSAKKGKGPVVVVEEQEEEEVKEEDLPLDEQIELQRARLPKPGTKITPEVFKSWQKRRQKKLARERKKQLEAGLLPESKAKSKMSGKELFTKNANLFDSGFGDEGDDVEISDAVAEEGAGAGAGAGAAEAVGAEDAALFLDDVAVDDLDDLDDLEDEEGAEKTT